MIKIRIHLLFLLIFTCSACRQDPVCTPSITLSPSPTSNTITVDGNTSITIEANINLCGASNTDYTYTWFYDSDGNGTLSSAELSSPYAETPELTLNVCSNTDAGIHPVQLIVEPSSLDAENLPTLSKAFSIEVLATETNISRPSCYLDAAAIIQTAEDISPEDLDDFILARECFDEYLVDNICDFEAAYLSTLAHLTEINLTIMQITDPADYNETDIIDLVDENITQMVNNLNAIVDKADTSFQVQIPGLYQLSWLTTNDDDEIIPANLVLQGEHDFTDAQFLLGVIQMVKGWLELILAYDGLVPFSLSVLDSDLSNSEIIDLTLAELVGDPDFLTLRTGQTPTGKNRLLRSRNAFIQSIQNLEAAYASLQQETDPQKDDILRYWDCGSDGICDCSDTAEIFYACPIEGSYTTADSNGSEANGEYDFGEPIGLDRFGKPDFVATYEAANQRTVERILGYAQILLDNLRGPNALNLNAIAGINLDIVVFISYSVPKPSIRLSQWFLSPADLRDLFPLYSISDLAFITERESELYEDVGYDGKADEQETIVDAGNPLGLSLGTAYNLESNPDPHFDNLDPLCNPICNESDGIDNDADGLIDADDELFEFGYTLDRGVEGNFFFDFVDLNHNFSHDLGEPSEPFTDSGTINAAGETIGANDGKWSFADRHHTYPRGNDVAPFSNIRQTDPPNGVSGTILSATLSDQTVRTNLQPSLESEVAIGYEGLFDPIYYFFPDATFSGMIEFEQNIESFTGEDLTDNAKLHRFFSKLVEIGLLFPVDQRSGDNLITPGHEGKGHPCGNSDEICIAEAEKGLDE